MSEKVCQSRREIGKFKDFDGRYLEQFLSVQPPPLVLGSYAPGG